jgi:hypothetical protein
MQTFIANFRALRAAEREARLEEMAAFLSTFEAARRHFERRGVDLNLFDLLGLKTDEVSHSAFLAWLFDPGASHGQGGRFLQAFLNAARPEITLQLPETYRVQTELSGRDAIVDIAAFRAKDFIVYVENKTVSPDTPGQHDREIRDLRRLGATLGVPGERQVPVYLTPYGRRARGEHRKLWHRVSYGDLSVAFSRLLPEISDERSSLLLDDWLDTTTHFGGVWRYKMNGVSDAAVLLVSNWPTVLSIQEALDDLEDELLAMLFSMEAALVQQDWWQEGWIFRRPRKEIYIGNTDWVDGKGHWPLWMGVYSFKPDRVFGPGAPPVFYFRTRSNYDALGDVLREALRDEGHQVLEDHRHLLHRAVQQCPHDRAAVEAYPDQVREQMVALFTEYVDFATRHEDVIRRHAARHAESE